MSILARRQRLPNPDRAAHPGLILSRYLEQQSDPGSRQQLLENAALALVATLPIYRAAFERWKMLLVDRPSVRTIQLGTGSDGRLVIGLGSESVLETGLTLHHTYGTPFISGSALKGLVSHYCHSNAAILGPEMSSQIRELDTRGEWTIRSGKDYCVLFGDTQSRGFLTFLDAWMLPESINEGTLVQDIMTPHHTQYYGEASYSDVVQVPANLRGTRVPPEDTDSPIPLRFLSITGEFLIAVQCEDLSEQGTGWLEWCLELTKRALAETGIGGKTSSGYGRLLPKQIKREPPPQNGALVEAVVIEEVTKSGGRKVIHEPSQLIGVVVNNKDVPENTKPGDKLVVKVNSNNSANASFYFVRVG